MSITSYVSFIVQFSENKSVRKIKFLARNILETKNIILDIFVFLYDECYAQGLCLCLKQENVKESSFSRFHELVCDCVLS